MDDTEKYLIHAAVTAEGVVERSDVVGAIFGQTEGLLGDELDLPELRRTSKLGRIDVSVSSSGGESRGKITIATSLDKVETATLAASLETIDRVGPCRAAFSVDEIEDVRAAKRRAVVDRATELLRTGFDDSVMSSAEILSSVREHVRVADITEYEGLPAGPRVAESDAIIVVEGRSDVLTLLRYGIKNAIGVEGTNVPNEIAAISRDRTVTAFLDADRGGELILEELRQIGEVDYVARPPSGASVEDLDHHDVFAALRNKEPIGPDATPSLASATEPTDTVESVSATDRDQPSQPTSSTDGGAAVGHIDGDGSAVASPTRTGEGPKTGVGSDPSDEGPTGDPVSDERESTTVVGPSIDESTTSPPATATQRTESVESTEPAEGMTLYDHVDAIVTDGRTGIRFLDDDRAPLGDYPASQASDALEAVDHTPAVMILDDVLSQELLDQAASRGVSMIVASELGQFVKRPTGVRVYEADAIASDPPAED